MFEISHHLATLAERIPCYQFFINDLFAFIERRLESGNTLLMISFEQSSDNDNGDECVRFDL